MLGMFAAWIAVVLFGLGAAAGRAAGASQAPAYSARPSTMEMTIASVPLTASDGAIHVDQRCALLPDPAEGERKPRWDPAICHLETINHSSHREETVVGNEVERRDVEVREQEYVLQNVTLKEVAFLVEQPVAKGWMVDSDPQPVEMQGTTAVFRVYAEPGEIVRLHVGVRRSKQLPSKTMH
jgi:hypothetical protein